MAIPTFKQYFPSIDAMTPTQRKFYKKVEQQLSHGKYIEIDGNISYVFVFLYHLLAKWNSKGFEKLSDYLLHLSELYAHEEKLSGTCRFWAYECLLGLEKYDEYLEKTEPVEILGTSTHQSNLRLNIEREIGQSANSSDILLMCGGRKTKFITNNHGLYKDKIREVFSKYEEENGDWFSIMDEWLKSQRKYDHSLFPGAMMMNKPKLSFQTAPFYTIKELLELSKTLSKDAENLAREELGVPLIGEGWVSETELYKKLQAQYPETIVIQHGQPEWLGRQHFDIWFPHWKIAVEYHGKQHFEPVDFFGGEEAFKKNVERDKRKANLARRHRVSLFIVTEDDDIQDVIDLIQEKAESRIFNAPK